MRQIAVSVSDRVPNVFFDNKNQLECLGLGNGFDDIGYGFVSI